MKNILTIDVEDWFHILDIDAEPTMETWDTYPSRVEYNFLRLLDIMDETETKSTCFFLGWIAQRFPRLVIEAKNRGHEIASHGCSHQLIYKQTRAEFLYDIQTAKQQIEEKAQCPVIGYRAPGFSITNATPWAMEALWEAGYSFDSSIFPAVRCHGGIKNAQTKPHPLSLPNGILLEYPITVTSFFGKRYCFSGGGYFRFFPYHWIARETRKLNRKGLPVICYLHPRDIDPDQPRLPMSTIRRFKCYINLQHTVEKLRRYLLDFTFTSIAKWEQEKQINTEKNVRDTV